ncbi:hypothetical protein DUNSADRAFT_12774 [Dunaliella salina]|uniref:Uncharacterized protein n=1 Tax=Dunaliella salina TaxID=3046 RepID=A0ABQ7GAM5_DUNSA|nr:hypothetical protein DUNSADRAFT_12774 [Dunaliella salina]|eukprot:KAF5831646.1 hypothetical protein DUNSADRAFT_12774 [Dunaliella salina]
MLFILRMHYEIWSGVKDPRDPELRDYYVALADREDPTLELWKAYWVANIKKSIVDAKRDFDRPLNKVTFVAIYGGAQGAQLERREVIKLGMLLQNRQEIEVAMDVAVGSAARMLVCGLDYNTYCKGCSAGLHLITLAVRKIAFCTPIKSPKLQMMVVTPDDLRDYLTKDEASVLEDAFVAGKVPLDPMMVPPEQQVKQPLLSSN